MRHDVEYLEIIKRQDKTEMQAFTAGYVAAMEVYHQCCPVSDADLSSCHLQSFIVSQILAQMKADEEQVRKAATAVINQFAPARCRSARLGVPSQQSKDTEKSANEPVGMKGFGYVTLTGQNLDEDEATAFIIDLMASNAFSKILQACNREVKPDMKVNPQQCPHDCMHKGDVFNKCPGCGSCDACKGEATEGTNS